MTARLLFSYCFAILFISSKVLAQNQDTLKNIQTSDNIKKGWNFGALPALAFDTDLGFRYGALMNLYNYGDGTVYPGYRHSIYMEWSRTTSGSGTNQFVYDSNYLIPGISVTAEASLLTEQALDFYGFNGYESYYNPTIEDTLSRMYYRYDRHLTRLKVDCKGRFFGVKNTKWISGITFFHTRIDTVDIDKLNRGKDEEDKIPYCKTLFDKYVQWGIIPENQKNGGNNCMISLGLVYDTRDNEPNPMKGIWTDILLLTCPSFLGNKFAYNRISITHRQYFTIIPENLNLACRFSYQAKISGAMPYYMLPYFYEPKYMRDGLGGGKTLRGIKRNRVVGEDFFMGNIELRWKFYHTLRFKQNFYFALTPFVDFGKITGRYSYSVNQEYQQEATSYLNEGKKETMHISYGAGIYCAMNRNFIVACSYGQAIDADDGKNGFYINLNYLF